MPRKKLQTAFNEAGEPEKSLSDDPELMFAAQRLYDADADMTDAVKEAVKEYKDANKHIVDLVKSKGLPNGRYRVGEFILDVKDRNGGGFKVDAWQSKAVSLGSFAN